MPYSLLLHCQRLYAELDRLLDGELSLWQRLLAKGHLMMCPKCRVYLDQYAKVRELSATTDPQDLPADFDAVMSSVVERWKRERDSDA
jgi:predicted anti-sigma-YlaC factor YlaD